MTLQSVLVTDTNIWIDLENGGILAEVFLLPRKFLIPDLAIRELIRPMWLHSPKRVAGLTMLIMIAVQVAALREYQVRRHIAQTGELVQGLMPENRFSTWIISNKSTIPEAIRQVML